MSINYKGGNLKEKKKRRNEEKVRKLKGIKRGMKEMFMVGVKGEA